MITKVFKAIGLLGSVFLIGSSNYLLTKVILGEVTDVIIGISIYFLAGIIYLVGISILAGAYALSAGSRDIPLGITLFVVGILHYIPFVTAFYVNYEILIYWGLQFLLSIVMSTLSFYLAYRKLRKRLVEINVSRAVEF